jgi:hypothetical protein
MRAGAFSGDLTDALRDLPAVTAVVVSEPSVYAYQMALGQVTVRAGGDATIITATTLCQ